MHVVPGGMIFLDSSLIERKVKRDDVTVYEIPATRLAGENGFPTLANMIIIGKILKELDESQPDAVEAALGKVISAKHADMKDVNRRAISLGASL